MNEPTLREVLMSVAPCAVTTARLLATGRLAMPGDRADTEVVFADGSRSVVFRKPWYAIGCRRNQWCRWSGSYNYDRPRGGLDGQTPYERLRQKTQAKPRPCRRTRVRHLKPTDGGQPNASTPPVD